MLVYKDLYSGDEVCSDAYRHLDPFEMPELSDVAFEVKSSKVAKGNDDYGVACNDEEAGTCGSDPSVETVIDIVEGFGLQEINMTKSEYTVYIKKYIKRVVDTLGESKPDRVPLFKEGASKFVKHILSSFDDFEFYTGGSIDFEAGLVYGYYKGEEVAPRLVYLKDGLVEERY